MYTLVTVDAKTNSHPSIIKVFCFQDGKLSSNIIINMENYLALLNYLAFFPEKDFVKIKTGLNAYSQQFVIHFLDKRFIKENFIGILTVHEYGIPEPFDYWGVEEMMAEYIFEYYIDLIKENPTTDEAFWASYLEWLSPQVADFFNDWSDAKKKFEQQKNQQQKNSLANMFSQIVSNQKNESSKKNIPFSNSFLPSINKTSPSSGSNVLVDTTEIECWWDMQIINEFGQPLTEVISFLNADSFIMDDETEKITQNLESMSLSALKILLDQQGQQWIIRYLKMRLKNEMGFQYIFFNTVSIKNVRYLLIMNVANYDLSQGTCIQVFRGMELPLLEKLGDEILNNDFLFSGQGQLKDPNDQTKLHHIIVEIARSFFQP